MRTIEEIYEELLSAFQTAAGYEMDPGCDLAVRFYALASQLQALEIQADWVLDQSFPQTAQGVYLDRHALMRGLSRMEATKAAGTLRFGVTSASAYDLTIPAGTTCMTAAGTRFQTLADCVLTAGQLTADASAQALDSGGAGNTAAGQITTMAACPVGITSCTNPAAFLGGTDAESDDALRQRILASYQRLPNGANAAYYEQTAMQHAGVAAARAVGRARGIGTVDVYVATEAGVPSSALLAEVQTDLQQKREIAVDVQALAPTTQTVPVTAQIQTKAGASFAAVKAAVEQAVTELFGGSLLGGGAAGRAGKAHLCGAGRCKLSALRSGSRFGGGRYRAARAGDADDYPDGGVRNGDL